MRIWKRKTSPLVEEVRGLKSMIKTLQADIDDLAEKLEQCLEKSEKKTGFLENQLNAKSSFIERLLEGTLANGHAQDHKNGKSSNLIDITQFDAATQTYIQNKIKNAATPVKKLPG